MAESQKSATVEPPVPVEKPVTRHGICQVLEISDPTLTGLIKAGLPHFKIGVTYRFEPSRVLEWLREQA